MRDGWKGNVALQERLQRPDPGAHLRIHAVREVTADILDVPADWSSGAGITTLADGGAKITGTRATLASGAGTNPDNVITNLPPGRPFGAVQVLFEHSVDRDREIDAVTARLDPNVDGTGVEVTHWVCRLFRTVSIDANDQHTLSEIAKKQVEHSGTSEQDVTFDFGGAGKSTAPRVGDPPDTDPEATIDNRPRIWVLIFPLKGEGEEAGNVAWTGDGTASTTTSGTEWEARYRELTLTEGPEAQEADKYGVSVPASGMVDFSLSDLSFSAQTNTYAIDLGAAPEADTDLEVVVGTQLFGGSSVTTEISDDGGTSWAECADGDVIGEDNTDQGGNDLSGVSRQQTYDLRVTWTPSGGVSPIVRRFGVRELEATDVTDVASLTDYTVAIDPVDLHSEIAGATFTFAKDGILDYRDLFSQLFSENHISDIELRTWVGHPDLDRKHWMQHTDFLVDDTRSRPEAGVVSAVNMLIHLRGLIPLWDSATNERSPKEYANQKLSAVYDDLLTAQLDVPDRRIGPGPTDLRIDSDGDGVLDSDALVTKRITESDGKREVEAIARLAGGSVISSQGRIKFVRVHETGDTSPSGDPDPEPAPHVVEWFPMDEADVGEVSPGYTERVDEYFVPWGWERDSDQGRGRYIGEVRDFHSAGLTKLGDAQVRSGEPPRLEDVVARWIPQSGTDANNDPVSGLAELMADRQVTSLGTGMITVPVRVPYAHPHLELGDVVAVETDRFVARDPNTDREIRGVFWVRGPIVRIDDPMGTSFTVWVRSYADIVGSRDRLLRKEYVRPQTDTLDVAIKDGTGEVVVEIGGNADAAKHYVTVGENTAPADPDGAGNENATLSSRNGTVATGVTVSKGSEAVVKVRAEAGDGTLADAGDIKQARATRPGTGSDPEVQPSVDYSVDSSDSTQVTFTVTGSLGGDGVGPLEVRHRTNAFGSVGTWSAWAAAPKSGVTVSRTGREDKDFDIQSRDAGLGVRSEIKTVTVQARNEGLNTTDGKLVSEQVDVDVVPETVDRGFILPDYVDGSRRVTKVRDTTRTTDRTGVELYEEGVSKDQNLLDMQSASGTRPGEETSSTGTFIWNTGTTRPTLAELQLDVGDVISAGAQVKSDTGADRIRVDIRFRDSAGTIISTVTGTPVTSSTYTRAVNRDVTIPANTDVVQLIVRNVDTTETAFARRIVLNRGPRAIGYHEPPFRFERDRQLPGDTDIKGDVYVPPANAPRVGTVASPGSLSKRWWFAFAAVQPKLTAGSVEDLSTSGWSIHPGSGDGVEKTGHLTFTLQPGVTITSVTLRMRRATTSDSARFFLYRINDDSTTSLGSASHGTTGWADVTLSGVNEPVNTGEHFYIQILLTSTTNSDDAEFSRGHVAYDMASYADTL